MKTEIRSKIKDIRKEISLEVRQRKSEVIVSAVISILERMMVDKGAYKKIGLYYPVGSEVDIRDLYDYLWRRDVKISLPRTFKLKNNNEMEFLLFEESTALIHNNGLVEPPKNAEFQIPEIFIIPIIAFDNKLHRIGSGKGFYDRYLANNPSAIKIGVAFSEQQVAKINHEFSDVPMDIIVTDQGVFR